MSRYPPVRVPEVADNRPSNGLPPAVPPKPPPSPSSTYISTATSTASDRIPSEPMGRQQILTNKTPSSTSQPVSHSQFHPKQQQHDHKHTVQQQQKINQISAPAIETKNDESLQTQAERVFCVEDDDQLTVPQLMISGGLAGITEHVAMFPIDTIKTRMQSYVAIRDVSNTSMLKTTRTIVSTEGFPALWRGVPAVALSSGPAHALYFATYELVTQFLSSQTFFKSNNTLSGSSGSNKNTVNPLVTSIAGGCATIVGDGVMTPLDVVKQRMQLSSKARYTSTFECTRQVYANHGLRAFYAGYKATLLMNIPFTAVYFTGYETVKRALLDWRHIDGDAHFSASSHCVAGACAGAAAAAITNPLDVVKTRLQTQGEVGARRYRGLVDALRSIRVEEGIPGLFRGVRARVLFHMPAAAVCWTTYEFCKHVLRRVGPSPTTSTN